MDAQRLEMERRLKQLERRLQGVVAASILSIIGMLMLGLMVGSALSTPAVPPVLTVSGLKVMDERGQACVH